MKLVTGSFGCAAVFLWILLFAAGLLLDSAPYRRALPAGTALAATSAGEAPLPAEGGRSEVRDFVLSVILYTPLNVALLTLLAGFVGGCASKVTYNGGPSDHSTGSDPPANRSSPFLTENPLASTLRSFVVYLSLIAGVYITSDQPFEAATVNQYVRFAGTVSLISFVVGYDPTKFQRLVDLVPMTRK
jgi:hypothetical protein